MNDRSWHLCDMPTGSEDVRLSGITDMLADIGPQCNPHCPRIVQELF
jgi:hypothetical protein